MSKTMNCNTSKSAERYVIARTNSAGVFCGRLERKEGKEVTLTDARRLWYWAGAATLSQLAEEGVKKPKECKFPISVTRVTLTDTIEILEVSEKALQSICAVPIWAE